jgi:hypothetical protein
MLVVRNAVSDQCNDRDAVLGWETRQETIEGLMGVEDVDIS